MSIVKIRLAGMRKVKPIWVDSYKFNETAKDIKTFCSKYCSNRIPMNHYIAPMILLEQDYPWNIEGYENRVRCIKIGKYYKSKKRFIVNTNLSKWEAKGIYNVPKVKTLMRSDRLSDPSGINVATNHKILHYILDNIIAIYYQNTVNYAKYKDNCTIRFFIDGNESPVNAKEFIGELYSRWEDGKAYYKSLKCLTRMINNSVYGFMPILNSVMPKYDFNVPIDVEFGSFNIVCRDNLGGYEYTMSMGTTVNGKDPLYNTLKDVIKENNINIRDLELDITFVAKTPSMVNLVENLNLL